MESNDKRLWFAARDGEQVLVKELLEKDVIPNWGEEEGGFSALHEAALFGHKNVVENLIEAGWDLNLKSFSGHTPLHNAAMGGKPQTRPFYPGNGYRRSEGET